MNYPCKDCKDKYLGCHGSCEEYLKVKNENDKRKSEMYKHYMNTETIKRLEINRKRSMTHRKRLIKDEK